MLLLGALRTSTKLNIFLGVRNTYAGLLPDQMRHLATPRTGGRVNPLFPPALAAAVLAAAPGEPSLPGPHRRTDMPRAVVPTEAT